MTQYCIAGFKKIKSQNQFTRFSNHNNRIYITEKERPHIDPNRIKLNRVLVNTLNVDTTKANDMGRTVSKFYNEHNVQVKHDSVLGIDIMLTASPDFFGKWQHKGKILDERKINDWVDTQLNFIRDVFGQEALKYAVLHLDEKTPHIHLLVTPEQSKIVKYKNQFGTFEKATTTLNANRFNPNFWKKFLKQYEQANKKFGLQKGVENSSAKHTKPREYHEVIEQAANTNFDNALLKVIKEVVNDLSMLNTKSKVEDTLKNALLPKLKPMLKAIKMYQAHSKVDREKEYQFIKQTKKALNDELELLEHKKQLNLKIHDLQKDFGQQEEVIMSLKKDNMKLEEKLKLAYSSNKLTNEFHL